jgi:hypothetical protein
LGGSDGITVMAARILAHCKDATKT